MSIITREQAKDLRNAFQCWQQDYDPVEDKEQYYMFGLGMVAMDALLASLEPVSVIKIDHESSLIKHVKRVVSETNAPPAPVSVPDAMEMDDDFDSAFEHGKAVGWNACRAAMLQGADGALTDEDAKRVDELVMWIKRLAHSLRKANPDSKLQSDAMDYLSRKGLIGVEDILR
ncbi:hypothetical protein ABKV53_22535 [Enterobacter cloacae]|uniref:hypothetical protein n=1 Tax=Enterobacter cloacae TaxID=550 RepID=UPI0032AED9DB